MTGPMTRDQQLLTEILQELREAKARDVRLIALLERSAGAQASEELTCPECQRPFSSPAALRAHRAVHKKAAPGGK